MTESKHAHFEDKSALQHVVERRVSELSAAAEEHGLEAPSYVATASDAARETAVTLAMLLAVLVGLGVSTMELLCATVVFGTGYMLWKLGRSAHLGWARLERLHRVIEQERWEIQHHRPQEREELAALYAAKGFEGRLLEDVLDVLMADEDRLLRVMLLEELGLPLESYEHPLKQAAGAGLGALASAALCCTSLALLGPWGLLGSAGIMVALAGSVNAAGRGNRLLPAIIWNLSLGGLAFGAAVFLLDFLSHVL